MHPPPEVRIVPVTPDNTRHLDGARTLMREYAEELGVDLEFQDFERELEELPGAYALPGGTLLLALIDETIAGCCALRAIVDIDYSNAAEMKRLYVRPAFRHFGLGRELAEAVLAAAQHLGYDCVVLDTLDDMEAARSLYEELGFEEIEPYYHNPLAGAHYLKVDL